METWPHFSLHLFLIILYIHELALVTRLLYTQIMLGKNLVLILKFVDFYKWATCIHYSSGIIQYYTQIN